MAVMLVRSRFARIGLICTGLTDCTVPCQRRRGRDIDFYIDDCFIFMDIRCNVRLAAYR